MICILRSLIWSLACIITDVVVSDGIQCSVILKLFQCVVEFFGKICVVLGNTDRILLFIKYVIDKLKVIILINELLGRLAVDNHAVDLALFQSHYCIVTFIISLYCCIFDICSDGVTGSSKLNTDLLSGKIICALDLICCKNSGCHGYCHSCRKCKCHKFSLHFFFLLNSLVHRERGCFFLLMQQRISRCTA